MHFSTTGAALASGLFCWSSLWYARVKKDDRHTHSDLIFLVICEGISLWQSYALRSDWSLEWAIYSVHICVSFLLWVVTSNRKSHGTQNDVDGSPSTSDVEKLHRMKPRIFPCRTKHTRLFPKRNTFTYPYLLVGVPVGWHGRINWMLSSGSSNSTPRGWFHVNCEDYMYRDGRSLEDKLCAYLSEQGVDPTKYPYAYLVTAPRVLGYAFNPVSFWYLYDEERRLRAMVLEVNNTFDERRMYFLPAANSEQLAVRPATISETDKELEDLDETKTHLSSHNAQGVHDAARKIDFLAAWQKDFHVSPFNSRKGSYALKAEDVRPWEDDSQGRIGNAITLISTQNHGKLVASISSVSAPIDPSRDCQSFRVRCRLAWWALTGFLTFPRILRQAWKLFVDRKLHVWFRPEVTKESIGRNPTPEERIIERYFAAYLQHRTEKATSPLVVHYIPAPGVHHNRGAFSANCSDADRVPETLEIRVLSPGFYSRFVHYSDTRQALDGECLRTDIKNQTIVISRPELLPKLLDNLRKDSSLLSAGQVSLPITSRVRWEGLRRLRCPPPSQSYEQVPSDLQDGQDVEHRSLSPLDRYVIGESRTLEIYRRAVTKVFISQRLVGGLTICLSALDSASRLAMVSTILLFRGNWAATGAGPLLDSRQLAWSAAESGPATPWNVLRCIALLNANHLWAWLKGI